MMLFECITCIDRDTGAKAGCSHGSTQIKRILRSMLGLALLVVAKRDLNKGKTQLRTEQNTGGKEEAAQHPVEAVPT